MVHTKQYIWKSSLSTLLYCRGSHPEKGRIGDRLEEKGDLEFFRSLRVTKETFEKVLNIVENNYEGLPPVPAKTCLQIGLRYLGSGDTCRDMAESFGYTESCIDSCTQTIVKILREVGSQFIRWPRGQDAHEAERLFEELSGVPGVIGAMDSCFITIKEPNVYGSHFLNRRKKYSVHLLAVCDPNNRFTYTEAGFPGSAHDSRVFRNTMLHHRMCTSPEDLFPSNSHHITGDALFQLSNHVLVPYRGKLTLTQARFNSKLSQIRGVAESTFELLTRRFRRLNYVDADLSRVPGIIIACCILHNIALQNPKEKEYLNLDPETPCPLDRDNVRAAINLPYISGKYKRDLVAQLL